MTATTVTTEKRPTTEQAWPSDVERITEIAGAKLNIAACRWTGEMERAANWHLFSLLGEVTGRVEGGGGVHTQRGNPEDWMRLRDVDASVLEAQVRRIAQNPKYTGWKLDAPDGLDIRDALDVHFGRAYRRWQRERGA